MMFSMGVVMIILGRIGLCFTSPWNMDWRDYTGMGFVCAGGTLCVASLLEFASRYLI